MVDQFDNWIDLTAGRLRMRVAGFAEEAAPYTYNRRNVSSDEQARDIRVGKLGEIAFAEYLSRQGKIVVGIETMFEVWRDTKIGDKKDFETMTGQKVDVKTASRSNHQRILIPADQFRFSRKDFYVGVRITEDEQRACIVGYTKADAIEEAGIWGGARHHPAYAMLLSELMPIEGLLEMMPDRPKGSLRYTYPEYLTE